MKKLTAGIFTVLIGLCAANSADAAVASKDYADAVANAAQATAISAAAADATTKADAAKVAAEKTASDALQAYKTEQEAVDSGQNTNISNLTSLVGTLPEDTTAKDVVEYINKKTEGIATDAALTELQGAVSTNTDAIATINGDANTAGSFAKAIADSINALSAEDGAITTVANALATHEEFAEQTYATKTEISDMQTKANIVTENETLGEDVDKDTVYPSFARTDSMVTGAVREINNTIDTLETQISGVSSSMSAAVTNLQSKDTEIAGDIDALEGRMTTAEGDIDALETTLNNETDGLIKKVAANAALAAKNAEDVASNAKAIGDNTAAITKNTEAIATNTASIKTINEGAVMTSGITKEKVDAFDASKVVTDGINAGDITEAGKYVLTATVGEDGVVSDYKWEIIERSQPTGDEA